MLRLRSSILALALVGLAVLPVSARIMAPAPIPDRVAKADTVVVGKVTRIEDKGVTIEGTEFKIAIVQVKDALKGGDNQTHLRVAFLPNARFPTFSVQKDLDVLLFLSRVKGEPYYTTRMYFDVVNQNHASWAHDVAAAKACAKVLANVDQVLKEGKPEEKLLAAALLILDYRDSTGTSGKQEAIDPARSKAILLALAGADWGNPNPESPLGSLNAQTLFFRLGVTAADGWTPPKNFAMFGVEAKKWLQANADRFVIKKFLPAEK